MQVMLTVNYALILLIVPCPSAKLYLFALSLVSSGFECRIVQGASRVLSKVQIIPFEFTNHLLGAFHCKPQELWDMLTHAGFDIYTRDTYTQIPSNPIREDESSPQQLELLAARSGFQEKLLRAKHEEFSGELVQ